MRFDFVTAAVFKPLRHCVTPPLYFAAQNTGEEGEMPRNATGHGRGGGGEVSNVN